jgi:RNase H-like domain found in reverse transcriptase/Integrase zinc binding domain
MLNRRERRAMVRTLYKRKGRKVLPANIPLEHGEAPGGGVNGDEISPGFTPTIVPRGSRLTPARLARMRIGTGFLSQGEKQLFIDILFEFEGAIAFEDSEMGLLNPAIEPPVQIHTVPHVPWQQQNIRLPKAMQEAATTIVREKLHHGTLEYCQGPYRSRFFLVEKHKKGAYRLINDVQPLNRVTVRDSGLPPSVDEFSEDFAGYPITSAMDYYSGYYQVPLSMTSRDLTAFMTDLGLVRITRLPQGWTNSVSIFIRIIGKVHCRQIPQQVRPFLDDCGIKGPKSRYDDEEIEVETSLGKTKVRRFVFEHAGIFRVYMRDCWMAGLTISGEKSAIGMSGIEIVGFLCDEEGRRTDPKKVMSILTWPAPRNVKEARGFVGIAVYYRMFISGFSIIAAPIFDLFRKGKIFEWTDDCQSAMDALKAAVTTAPVLITPDFSSSALPLYVNVDASTTIGWGVVMSQLQDDGSVRPARFDGGIWSDVEKRYDALKLECKALMNGLKKFRFWLYGRYFTVFTDSQTLVWLLNQPPNNLPNAMMTRWLSYIRLFDFDTRHVPGVKNGVADALSRRGRGPDDGEEKVDEEEAERYFEAKMYSISVDWGERADSEAKATNWEGKWRRDKFLARAYFNEAEYEGDDLVLGRYLESMQRPDGISDEEYRKLRRKARQFLVRDGRLYKRGRVPRRVVGLRNQRMEVIREMHDEVGHKGRITTFERVRRRYQWKRMFEDVAEWVKTCEDCQRRSKLRYEEGLHPTWSVMVFDKVGVDIVYMPVGEGGSFLVLARDDLSGWVEGRAIDVANSFNVSKFLYEEVVCRHGCPRQIVLDGGRENMGATEDLLEDYRIQNTIISAYHPQTAGLVERGHGPIINSLAKYCHHEPLSWPKHLALALWADRISVRRSTGYSAFELLYGRDCLLPVELLIESWQTVDWEAITSRDDLILARMQQLDHRRVSNTIAALNLRNSRKANKIYFDEHKRLRPQSQELREGDLVLVLDSSLQPNRHTKLYDNWRGPFRIIEQAETSTFYRLAELDGTPLKGTTAGNRLRKFYSRREIAEMSQLEEREEREDRNNDALAGGRIDEGMGEFGEEGSVGGEAIRGRRWEREGGRLQSIEG